MLKCKLCGTANNSDATVCSGCGTSLVEKEKKMSSTNTENEIFSSKNSDKSRLSHSSNEIYSSKSGYNEAQQRKIFEKIRRQEEAIGDVFDPEPPKKIEPVVINNRSIEEHSTQGTVKSRSSQPQQKRKIPQRIIESVDKQMLQQKMKPTTKPSALIEDDDEKVELTSSDVIERIRENHEHTMQMKKLQAEKQRQKKAANLQSEATRQGVKQKKAQAKQSASDTSDSEKAKSLKSPMKKNSFAKKAAEKFMVKPDLAEKEKTKTVANGKSKNAVQTAEKAVDTKVITTEKSNLASKSVKKDVVNSDSAKSSEKLPVKRNIVSSDNSVKTEKSSAEGKIVKKNTVNPDSVKSSEKLPVKRNIVSSDNSVKTEKSSAESKTVKKKTVNPDSVKSSEKLPVKRNIVSSDNSVKTEKSSAESKTFKKKTVNPDSVKPSEKLPVKRNIVSEDKNRIPQRKITDRKPVQKTTSELVTSQNTSTGKAIVKNTKKTVKSQMNLPSSRDISKDKKSSNVSEEKTVNSSASVFSKADIENNRYNAALAYIGILCFFSLYKGKHSDFCKAHAKQGIALFILSLVIYMITLAIVLGLRVLLLWTLKLPSVIYTISLLIVTALMLIGVYIPTLHGAMSALDGKLEKLPIVGKLFK